MNTSKLILNHDNYRVLRSQNEGVFIRNAGVDYAGEVVPELLKNKI